MKVGARRHSIWLVSALFASCLLIGVQDGHGQEYPHDIMDDVRALEEEEPEVDVGGPNYEGKMCTAADGSPLFPDDDSVRCFEGCALFKDPSAYQNYIDLCFQATPRNDELCAEAIEALDDAGCEFFCCPRSQQRGAR